MIKSKRLTAEELRNQPGSIPFNQLGWSSVPDYCSFASAMKLPNGVNAHDLLMKHSPPFLKDKGLLIADGPVLYPVHRGFIQAPERLDNTMASFLAALKFGARILEADVMMCKPGSPVQEPGFIFSHDRRAGRITYYSDDYWKNLALEEVEGLPIIVRKIRDSQFTDEFWVSDEKVTSVWTGSEDILNKYPGTTIIYDTKDDQSPDFVAALSKRPELCKGSIVQFYTWGPEDGRQFVSQINAVGAAVDWNDKIDFVPVVQIEPLAERYFATQPFNGKSAKAIYDDLFQFTVQWVESMMNKELKLKIFAVMIPLGGIGERYDKYTGTAIDRSGMPITDKEILTSYRDDRILIDLYYYMKQNHSRIPLGNIVRAYDVGQDGKRYKWGPIDGTPVEWGKLSDLLELHATPGKVRINYDFNFIVADLIIRALEFEAFYQTGVAREETSNNPWGNIQ